MSKRKKDITGQAPDPRKEVNYFDGRFLRAEDLQQERDHFRETAQLHNQDASGTGVVHGLDVEQEERDSDSEKEVKPNFAPREVEPAPSSRSRSTGRKLFRWMVRLLFVLLLIVLFLRLIARASSSD